MMQHHLILRVVTRLLAGTIMLFALYVQFHGDYSPGGGFQAGVLMAVGIIMYGLVFGLAQAQQVLPPWIVHKMVPLGVMIYCGTGWVAMFLGYTFLDYGAFSPAHPAHGQHWGIFAVEFGVGITVTGVMLSIYYAFAGRPPEISDEDW
jgi:multicomponent Na+:H+ antiporter subunit B